jgi:hypothetical protein
MISILYGGKMKVKFRALPLLVAGAVIFLAAPMLVNAQTNRAFIATTGSSSNTATLCQKTAPCRLWSDGLSVINDGGEVVALDDGGFGANVSVTKSAVLSGYGGRYAGFLVGAGTSGFVINAPGKRVVIREIQFTGVGGSSTSNGITVTAGGVVIDHCNFQFLGNGLNATGSGSTPSTWTRVDIYNSNFNYNINGILATGPGTEQIGAVNSPATAQLMVRVNGGNINQNTVGVKMGGRGYDANSIDLSNVFFFSQGGGPATNVAGNGTNYQCTDPNSANNNPCNAGPVTYNSQSGPGSNSPPM